MAGNAPPEGQAPIIDFTRGAMAFRLRARGYEALLAAFGKPIDPAARVVDATAGLGRDAFLLAYSGITLTLIERSPEIHDALAVALERARNAGAPWSDAVDRMTLLHGDSREILPRLDPAIVFVDPMHPPQRKSALVRKDMRALRTFAGAGDDAKDLIEVAIRCARKRVILKWPAHAELSPGLPEASHEIPGRKVRYAVFVPGRARL